MITAEKIVALAHYVRNRDGDALALPEHREFMREMSEFLMSVGKELEEFGFIELTIPREEVK
jgi:hypothetical protein